MKGGAFDITVCTSSLMSNELQASHACHMISGLQVLNAMTVCISPETFVLVTLHSRLEFILTSYLTLLAEEGRKNAG